MIMGAFTWLENNQKDFNKLFQLKKRKISLKIENEKKDPVEQAIPKKPKKKLPSWAKRATTGMEIDVFLQDQVKMAQLHQEEFDKKYAIPEFLKKKKESPGDETSLEDKAFIDYSDLYDLLTDEIKKKLKQNVPNKFNKYGANGDL